MLQFIQSGINIPSKNTLRRDLDENFKNSKEIFRKELQVVIFILFNKFKIDILLNQCKK